MGYVDEKREIPAGSVQLEDAKALSKVIPPLARAFNRGVVFRLYPYGVRCLAIVFVAEITTTLQSWQISPAVLLEGEGSAAEIPAVPARKKSA
jgi:hypothetical protein